MTKHRKSGHHAPTVREADRRRSGRGGVGRQLPLSRARAAAQQKTLKIIQWSHFVPGYDKWFDGVFTKEWGSKHDTEVIVDHIAIGEVNARAAAEVAAKKGHDLFMFLSPPAAYEKQVIDHGEIYESRREEARQEDRPGASKSTFNPKTKKYFAFSDSYVPDPGNYRKDLWEKVGFPNGPDTWDDLRDGGKKIKDQFGNPVGVGPLAGARHEHGDARAPVVVRRRRAGPRTATSRSTRSRRSRRSST